MTVHATPHDATKPALRGRLQRLAFSSPGTAEKSIYLAVFALLVASRIPVVFLEGRFWAEDGLVYFRAGWELPWRQALFLVYAGYLNLAASLTGVVTAKAITWHWLSLADAPFITTSLALALQCVPAAIILTSSESFLRARLATISALLLVMLAPISQEVWISAALSQFHLAFAATLILAFAVPRHTGATCFQLTILILAALSGPATWMLTPLFLLRAIFDRSTGRWLQLIAVAGATAIATLFFFEPSDRTLGISPTLLGAAVFIKHIAAPLLGFQIADDIGKDLIAQFQANAAPLWPLLTVLGIACLGAIAMARHIQSPLPWLFTAAALLACGSYYGSIGGDKSFLVAVIPGGRYALAPNLAVALGLLYLAMRGSWPEKLVSAILVCWLIGVGASEYYSSPVALFTEGPNWRDEVAEWQQNPAHALKIWPQGWDIRLSPDHRPIPQSPR